MSAYTGALLRSTCWRRASSGAAPPADASLYSFEGKTSAFLGGDTGGDHPFPYRTRKLSPPGPKVLRKGENRSLPKLVWRPPQSQRWSLSLSEPYSRRSACAALVSGFLLVNAQHYGLLRTGEHG